MDTSIKFDVMKDAGADYLIDYTKTDYLADGAVFDGILDVVGKTSLKKGLAKLNIDGVYMHANPKISHMFFKRILSGSSKRIIIKGANENHKDLDYLAQLMQEGKIRTIIDKVMPMEEIVSAHEYVEAGYKKGNIVITIRHY